MFLYGTYSYLFAILVMYGLINTYYSEILHTVNAPLKMCGLGGNQIAELLGVNVCSYYDNFKPDRVTAENNIQLLMYVHGKMLRHRFRLYCQHFGKPWLKGAYITPCFLFGRIATK
jgi:hypothetical protein